jgi:hypothetical protein
MPVLTRMFEKRLQAYRAIGYARGEAPLGYADPILEPTIEYDNEALRYFDETVSGAILIRPLTASKPPLRLLH